MALLLIQVRGWEKNNTDTLKRHDSAGMEKARHFNLENLVNACYGHVMHDAFQRSTGLAYLLERFVKESELTWWQISEAHHRIRRHRDHRAWIDGDLPTEE